MEVPYADDFSSKPTTHPQEIPRTKYIGFEVGAPVAERFDRYMLPGEPLLSAVGPPTNDERVLIQSRAAWERYVLGGFLDLRVDKGKDDSPGRYEGDLGCTAAKRRTSALKRELEARGVPVADGYGALIHALTESPISRYQRAFAALAPCRITTLSLKFALESLRGRPRPDSRPDSAWWEEIGNGTYVQWQEQRRTLVEDWISGFTPCREKNQHLIIDWYERQAAAYELLGEPDRIYSEGWHGITVGKSSDLSGEVAASIVDTWADLVRTHRRGVVGFHLRDDSGGDIYVGQVSAPVVGFHPYLFERAVQGIRAAAVASVEKARESAVAAERKAREAEAAAQRRAAEVAAAAERKAREAEAAAQRRAAEVAAAAERKAREAEAQALKKRQRDEEERQRQNGLRIERLVAQLAKNSDESIGLFNVLPLILEAAKGFVIEARRHFDATAYSPFWTCVESAYQEFARYRSTLAELRERMVLHAQLNTDLGSTDTQVLAVAFPLAEEDIAATVAGENLVREAEKLVYRAQQDPVFAQIWEQRRTTAAIVQGFGNLDQAILRMQQTVRSQLSDLGEAYASIDSARARESDRQVASTTAVLKFLEQQHFDVTGKWVTPHG